MAAQWYYRKENGQFGPLTTRQLKDLAAQGQLASTDLVWTDGMVAWVEAGRTRGIFPSVGEPPPVEPAGSVGTTSRRTDGSTLSVQKPPSRRDQSASSVDLSTAEEVLQSGSLGEYELISPLGRGGMSTVYRARHTKLGKIVALKVLPTTSMKDPRAVARFDREMLAIGRLHHENIIQAYDAREVRGIRFLVTEYVEGVTLDQIVRAVGGDGLPVADACELIRQAVVGLCHAHDSGLVHRDVKPSNLMLSNGLLVKILDLGLALLRRGDRIEEEMTDSGQAMGTADYMAPEQVTDSHNVDVGADVYSLGCTAYKLLIGHAPFPGSEYHGSFAKMTAHVHTPPTPPGDLRQEIPEELSKLVIEMLLKDPNERPWMAEVGEVLTPWTKEADLAALLASTIASATNAKPDDSSSAVPPPSTAEYRGTRRTGRIV